MDLKGSLIDTNLRIHPSTKLIEFFKSMPIDNNVPINIIKLVKGRDYELRSKPKVEHILKIPIHLNSHDIEILNKIKATCKTEDSESVEVLEEKTILQSEVELSNNNSSMSSTPKKDKDEDLKQSKTECNDKSNMSEQDTNDKTKLSNKDSTKRSKKSKEECNEKIKDGSFDEAKETADEEELYLETSDIDWLYGYLQKSKSKGESVAYLHQLLDGIDIKMPQNKVIKRNPELEARCVKLRAQQEAREYRKMTKSVDNVRMRFPEDSISFQLKQVNRHLIAIGQFILSIFAGFLFGFKGVEWMIGSLDFGFRLLLGVMCALIISLAEIYFLAKKLNEELNIPETVQLGGPPKFADQQKYHEENVKSRAINKEHQD